MAGYDDLAKTDVGLEEDRLAWANGRGGRFKIAIAGAAEDYAAPRAEARAHRWPRPERPGSGPGRTGQPDFGAPSAADDGGLPGRNLGGAGGRGDTGGRSPAGRVLSRAGRPSATVRGPCVVLRADTANSMPDCCAGDMTG